MSDETIHAVATAPGRAAVAIVRVSGPNALPILRALTRQAAPESHRAALRKLYGPGDSMLDVGLVVYFPAGRSFTGEDVVEFQVHGSRAVVAALLRAIDGTQLSRPARAGDFTRRALLNDRLDVTQVQGLGDLIDAETEVQRRAAIRVMDGELGDVVRSWRRDLLMAAALVEVTIDFVDEDVPEDVTPDVVDALNRVRGSIEDQLRGIQSARRLQEGFVVAIIGRPNSGKSSLLNALTRSDAAIVSDVPGTTRDVVEVRMDVGGLLVRLQDTAGLRETEDVVEKIGVARARKHAQRADLRLLVVDPTQGEADGLEGDVPVDLVVRTKQDLVGGFGISSTTGRGVEDLVSSIGHALRDRVEAAGLVSSARDEAVLIRSRDSIEAGTKRVIAAEWDLAAEDIRSAVDALSEMIGDVDVEDILGHIFRSFCIGK